MMRIALRIKFVDGREQAVMVSAPDLIGFEETFDKKWTDISSGRLTYIYWVAWHAARREAMSPAEFENWKPSRAEFNAWVPTVDLVSDDEVADPEIVPLESSQPIG